MDLREQEASTHTHLQPPIQGKSLGYILGIDLGQAADYTALCIAERVLPVGATEATKAIHTAHFSGIVRSRKPSMDEYHIRHLERPALGTPYPVIAARVKELTHTWPLTSSTPVVIDRTGVGVAVGDIFTAAGITFHAITITGGNDVLRENRHHTKVPKRELVGQLVALFHSSRLKVAGDMQHAPTLVNELQNFKVKINLATGHDSYEAWRESIHDDLVLSVALACWYGENVRPNVGGTYA